MQEIQTLQTPFSVYLYFLLLFGDGVGGCCVSRTVVQFSKVVIKYMHVLDLSFKKIKQMLHQKKCFHLTRYTSFQPLWVNFLLHSPAQGLRGF